MKSRTIQLVGNRSYAITLPKEWVVRNGLKERHEIFVEETPTKDLVLRTKKTNSHESHAICVSLDEVEDVSEFIVYGYVKNLSSITITYKGLPSEVLVPLKNTLRHLEGFEITHQDETKLEINFLFQNVNISLPKITRRILYLLKIMVAVLADENKDGLSEAETSIDRLYHLSKRILFACMSDTTLRHENEIASDEHLFFIREIMRKLENIADNILMLGEQKTSRSEYVFVEEHVQIIESLLLQRLKPHNAKEKLQEFDLPHTNARTALYLKRIEDLTFDIVENAMSIQFDKKYFPKR